MLSYPLFFALRDCFMGSSSASNLQPMSRLSSLLNQNNGLYHKYFKDVSLLATFVDKCVVVQCGSSVPIFVELFHVALLVFCVAVDTHAFTSKPRQCSVPQQTNKPAALPQCSLGSRFFRRHSDVRA
jgi:hypothetical protein